MVGYHGVSHITIDSMWIFVHSKALRDLMFFIDMANYRACHPSSQGMLCSLGGTSNSCCSYQNLFFAPPVWRGLLDFMSAGLHLLLLLLRRTSTTSTASSWSQWSPSGWSLKALNCKLVIAVVPAGPQLQVLDRSVPHLTRTATAGWKWP